MKNFFLIKKILILGFLIMTTNVAATAYYGVHVDLAAVGVDLLVNDIPLYSDHKSGQLTVEFPCPESIVDGYNELTVVGRVPKERDGTVAETFQPGAYVTARLFFQETDDAEKVYLSIVKLQANEKGILEQVEEAKKTDKDSVQKVQGEVGLSVTNFAKIKSAFPQWAWQGGLTIENNQKNYDSLLAAYKAVYDALAANDQHSLRTLYAKRAEEIAIAYHLDGVDMGHERISTGKDAQNSKLELHEFYTKDLQLQIYANGKIARLMDEVGLQPIVFIQRNPTLAHMHKFFFYKNEKNQWIMIR